MSWEDRPYYRDRPSRPMGGVFGWLLGGSVPLGTWLGIRVRAHVSLLFYLVYILLSFPDVGGARGALTYAGLLFAIVLLHEFGHCLASRMVGGDPRDILLWPLGGLAFADAPRRPWANFWTVLGGPLVNVIICAASAAVCIALGGWDAVPWNPWHWIAPGYSAHPGTLYYLWWVWAISWGLLLFNLCPIFPLDGGQLLQSLLWVKWGYYRSMKVATITGMVGAVVMAVVGLATHQFMLVAVAVGGFIYCLNLRRQLAAMGPEEWSDEPDYSAALYSGHSQPRRVPPSVMRSARRRERRARVEQARIDAILAKVSAHGMHSLTWREKRALRLATEHQRERDLLDSRHWRV